MSIGNSSGLFHAQRVPAGSSRDLRTFSLHPVGRVCLEHAVDRVCLEHAVGRVWFEIISRKIADIQLSYVFSHPVMHPISHTAAWALRLPDTHSDRHPDPQASRQLDTLALEIQTPRHLRSSSSGLAVYLPNWNIDAQTARDSGIETLRHADTQPPSQIGPFFLASLAGEFKFGSVRLRSSRVFCY